LLFLDANSELFEDGREGDFIELYDNAIFEVKGFIHAPGMLTCYPRYIPDEKGDRSKGSRCYIKVYPLKDRYRILKSKYPDILIDDPVFGMVVPEVPIKQISVLHKPNKYLEKMNSKKKLGKIEQIAIEFVNVISKYSGVDISNLGISGSIMVGLQNQKSDIDLIVYGKSESLLVQECMRNLFLKKETPRLLENGEMWNLYKTRFPDENIPYNIFKEHENRKTIQGKYQNREFFIRYLPKISEISEEYGDYSYKSYGNIEVKATITESSESHLTPCKYQIEVIEFINGKEVKNLDEVTSLRGRFCEQAYVNERVRISGKLEKVSSSIHESYRILLGSQDSDYMISDI
jgi:predicted nucleotidyltransferase